MGYEKNKRPTIAPRFEATAAGTTGTAPYRSKQKATVTIGSTATIIPLVGTAVLNATGTGDKTFRLPTPANGGRVNVSAVDSTHVHVVQTKTTAETFFGSTFQALTWSTSLAYRAATFEVVGAPGSLKWHVVSKSTGATLA